MKTPPCLQTVCTHTHVLAVLACLKGVRTVSPSLPRTAVPCPRPSASASRSRTPCPTWAWGKGGHPSVHQQNVNSIPCQENTHHIISYVHHFFHVLFFISRYVSYVCIMYVHNLSIYIYTHMHDMISTFHSTIPMKVPCWGGRRQKGRKKGGI